MSGRTDVDQVERRLIVQNAREFLSEHRVEPDEAKARHEWVWTKVGGLSWYVEALLRVVESLDPTVDGPDPDR